jgi:SSS family solute:Na+ symporter
VQHVPGNITAMTSKTANLLTVPIFGLFFFALFVPFASPAGVWIGTFAGVITATLVAFSGPIFGVDPRTGLDPVSFQWIAPVSVVVNITAGIIGSRLFPRSRPTA